jgi:hypothetical protein
MKVKAPRNEVKTDGWYWWKLSPKDEWEPRYFKFNEKTGKWIIRGIKQRPTRDHKEGMLGLSIESPESK